MREDPQDRERQVQGQVTFRDVAAVLAMLTVVTAIALIVIGMIYLFAPPVQHRPLIRTTESSESATAYCAAPASSIPSVLRSPGQATGLGWRTVLADCSRRNSGYLPDRL